MLHLDAERMLYIYPPSERRRAGSATGRKGARCTIINMAEFMGLILHHVGESDEAIQGAVLDDLVVDFLFCFLCKLRRSTEGFRQFVHVCTFVCVCLCLTDNSSVCPSFTHLSTIYLYFSLLDTPKYSLDT